MRSALCLLGLCGVFSAAGPARAQQAGEPPEGGVKRVAVLLLPNNTVRPEDQLQIQDALLRQAFVHSGQALAWQLVAFARLRPERNERLVLTEVDELIEGGKKDYRYLRLDEAQTAFEQAASLLRDQPPVRCDPKKLAEMYLYWARSQLDGGDDERAQTLLTQIARFDPKATPEPAVMPPNLVAAFDLALNARRVQPASRVLLEVAPAAGTLYVDCQQKPSGVVEISGPTGDEFWLGVEITGGRFVNRLTFPPGPRRHVIVYSAQPGDDALLADHLLGLSKQALTLISLDRRANSDLDALAGVLNVAALLVGELVEASKGRAVRLGFYVPGQGRVGRFLQVSLTDDGQPDEVKLTKVFEALAKDMKGPTLLAALTPKVEPDPIAPPVDDDLDESDDEGATAWYQTWWFWTATGVVVAGAAATGLVLGLTSGETEPSGEVILSIVPPR